MNLRDLARHQVLLGVGLFTILFWGLRIAYWESVTELPFSDMANFESVAHQVAQNGDFSWSQFWQTYSTPTLFAMRALVLTLFGDELIFWQFFQTTLLWCALVWLSLELRRLTGSSWLAVLLIAVVALSKPSIFWSLKLSRESIHEMFTYATAASFLLMLRNERWWAQLLFGLILMANVLNRPNSLAILPLAFAAYVAVDYLRARRNEGTTTFWSFAEIRRLVRIFTLVTVGVMLLWGPWIARNYSIYGELVPLSTQASYSFLWDLGQIKVRLPNDTVVVTDVNELQATASENFKTDLEASRYANQVAWAWIRENYLELPNHIMRRLKASVTIDVEYLSKVSRTSLFGNPIDYTILIDKSALGVILGCIGLLVLPLRYGFELAIIPVVAVIPWLTGAAIVGYPRMLDPSLPLIMFGSTVLVVVAAEWLFRWRRR
ncbi:hypothetical protein [Roseibium sediminis]|uniref:hypothetical protein n=1 Tax=Roseibium sediminis TaxID=1775174 RepID=UPI00123CE594|nr:hypothetical protein [Roseibium sediminis]